MLVASFPAAAFDTNCYVLAAAAGEEALIVDPGIGVEDELDEVLREHRLQPVAVLLTHGHIDHTFSVTPVCGARGIPAYLHPGDNHMLADPLSGISPESRAMFGGRLAWTEPDDVKPLTDGESLVIAGLELVIDHAPGHSPGSVTFRLPGAPEGIEARETMLTGDVLFAGSIGRTDLPGGDTAHMMASLARTVLPRDDDTLVLPGHGPRTTIGHERATNPFLRGLGAPAPARGL
jgi:glyoxylase-like metal-dependent hydrolase (beta-lactamase superfamily II)